MIDALTAGQYNHDLEERILRPVQRVRPAAVAGAFYPADPARLEAMVRGYLAAARREEMGLPPKALIVPHAGYVYSGPVAASAYALLAAVAPRIRRVVLLGPSHRVPFAGLAASSATHFETPLGLVPLDREAVARALALPQVSVLDRAHAGEHSLEVQLPFLQCVLGDFHLVPFAVGEASDAEVAEVLERLWGGEETLVVISSDLSHYHAYDEARRLDGETTRAIESLDGDALEWESACGRVGVRGLLALARRLRLRPQTLDVRNSGDTAGPRDRVVGYGAYVVQ
jgi:hypothetical protein